MRLEIESNAPTFVENVVADAAAENQAAEAVEALREGIRAAQSGDRSKARAALLRATEVDPSSESAWLWLASISEYPEELLVFLNNVLDLNPLNARATEWMAATKSLLAKTFVQRGIDAANGGQKEFAAQCFDQALEHDQNNAMAWLWMASLSDSNEGKMSYLEKVLELEPANQSAQSAYRSAKNAINQSLLAEARSAAVAGRKSDANELLDAFIAENPDSEDGWTLRSHLADKFEEKIAAFERVLLINPSNPSARAGLDSLKAIMDTVAASAVVAQPVTASDQMENTAFAVEAARQGEIEETHDKSPTQELVFPVAAFEMAENKSEPVMEVAPEMEAEPETGSNEQVVYFDEPVKMESIEVEVEPALEAAPENLEAAPEHSEIASNWGMNTVAFTFGFPGGALNEEDKNEEPAAASDSFDSPESIHVTAVDNDVTKVDSFDFTASPDPVYESASVNDDELFEAVSFDSEAVTEVPQFASEPMNAEVVAETVSFEAAPVMEEVEDFAPVPSPFSSVVTEDFSLSQADPGPSFVPDLSENGHSNGNGHSEFSDLLVELNTESNIFTTEPVVEQSIPMPPMDFSMPVFAPTTGFETRIVRTEQPEAAVVGVSACPYCHEENPMQAFTCGTCLSTLSLSDLEMLLSNTHADKFALREAVETMESERQKRALTESELTTLGIGYLNLRDLNTGYLYLHEASQLNPNNVVLSSQVNALLIRLDEIKRQEEAHDAMPKEKKILVVDDSATVRKLIAGKLEKCGHEVFCAADGVEALEQMDAIIPDLILLDINMPRMDGYQVCKVIRSKEATKDVPVVMISGKDGFFDKVRGRMAGSTGYITKPFGPETLMKAVETYLSGEEL